MNDFIDLWGGLADFGLFFKTNILINKTKVFVDDGKNTLYHYW